jgi:hypothetical protein
MKTAFIGAALACVLATPAFAGITCNLTDTRGNVLQYSFARGWEGGTNELRVLRNNIVLSNGGPVWSRFYNRGRDKLVLQQGNYSLAYDVRSDGLSPAGLFLGNNPIAMGTCGRTTRSTARSRRSRSKSKRRRSSTPRWLSRPRPRPPRTTAASMTSSAS